jgi:hypothetical protein
MGSGYGYGLESVEGESRGMMSSCRWITAVKDE